MNCCQPLQFPGIAALLQAGELKNSVLSCSEKSLSPPESLSLCTPATLLKDPSAVEMMPGTWAELSLPLPTVSGRFPFAGG